MPKLKTSKSAQKRLVKFSKTGKLIFRAMSSQHLASGKTKRTLSRSAKTFSLAKANLVQINKLLPYKK